MKQMAMVYYTAMKRLREFDDTASPVETLADLARVKGIGPFVLKNVEKRELTRLGLAPPPDPARVKAKLARREKRKRDKAAAAAAAATATTEVVTTTTSDESTTPIVKSVVVVKKKTRKVVVVQAASTTLTSVKRSSALSDVRRLLDQRPFFLDVETNGLARTSEVIELALVDCDGRVVLNSLVKPRGALSERALRVHGIEAHQLDAAPLWTALWRDEGARLLRELGARPIGAYNAPFDRRLLAQTSQDASFALADSSRWFCVMNLFRRIVGDLPNYSLANALQAANLKFDDDAHRALSDAERTRRLFLWLAEQREDKQ